MSKTRKSCLFSLVVLIVVVSVAWSFCLSHATSCTCNDICNIDNVANEARAAQWEYNIQISRINNEDADGLFPTWFTPGRYANVQAAVQARINSVSALGSCSPPLDTIRSDTNGGNCSITTQAQTACIKEYAMAHEGIHQTTCQSFSHIMTYQMSMSLVDVLSEEVRAYQTAIDMSKSMKAGPLKDCCCVNKCTPTTITPTAAAPSLLQIARNLFR